MLLCESCEFSFPPGGMMNHHERGSYCWGAKKAWEVMKLDTHIRRDEDFHILWVVLVDLAIGATHKISVASLVLRLI